MKIKIFNLESSLNIFHVTEGDWYTLLLEQNCTLEVGEGNRWDNMEYIRCRVERINPDADWEHCWKFARIQGLGPENNNSTYSGESSQDYKKEYKLNLQDPWMYNKLGR